MYKRQAWSCGVGRELTGWTFYFQLWINVCSVCVWVSLLLCRDRSIRYKACAIMSTVFTNRNVTRAPTHPCTHTQIYTNANSSYSPKRNARLALDKPKPLHIERILYCSGTVQNKIVVLDIIPSISKTMSPFLPHQTHSGINNLQRFDIRFIEKL